MMKNAVKKERPGPRGESTKREVRVSGGPMGRASRAAVNEHRPVSLVGSLGRIEGRGALLLLMGMSLAASTLMFPPMDWWWLGYVGLVPWLICVCSGKRARWVYLASWLYGAGFGAINMHWILPITMEGFIGICVYMSLFFPLMAWPIRHMYQRHGASLALVAPVVWVGAEYLRSIGPLGFPWVLLGHSQYQQITMIQISDLVGAYGVSFVLGMVNGWIADLLIQPIMVWRGDRRARLPLGTLATLVALAGTILYGVTQKSETGFRAGPRVALVQHDFPMFVDPARSGRVDPRDQYEGYLRLTEQAAAEKPDLIVLPETSMPAGINTEYVEGGPDLLKELLARRYPKNWPMSTVKAYHDFGLKIRNELAALSNRAGCSVVVGAAAYEWKPTAIPPRIDVYNSAYLFSPGHDKPVTRYDKRHLVMFGEYVPFRYSYHSIYQWLNSFTPWGADGRDYSLTAGDGYRVFEFEAGSQGGKRFRAAPPVCYEEAMPYIARAFTRGEGADAGQKKNVDMMVTISNDGWFLYSSELEQHLVTAVFRAVENRIGLVRSVNTGVSAFIRPNGRIQGRVEMSAEKRAAIPGVEAVLGRLEAAVAAGREVVEQMGSYESAIAEIGRILRDEVGKAFEPLGPEVGFIADRLISDGRFLQTRKTETRIERLEELRSQIADDREMVRRWAEKPWTAPSYSVARVACDDRLTFYTMFGDWFAVGMVALTAGMMGDWFVRRMKRSRKGSGVSGSGEVRVEGGKA